MTTQEFKNKGYVRLNNFLDKENCNQLTVELKKLVDEGKTEKDPHRRTYKLCDCLHVLYSIIQMDRQ
jgi:hypothetical protein